MYFNNELLSLIFTSSPIKVDEHLFIQILQQSNEPEI